MVIELGGTGEHRLLSFTKGSTEGSGYDASMQSARRENRPPYEDKIS